ncbi:MAG: carboxylating nicotinate-nucleotide diphosphorylase [Dehalococcoidia bacterium]
MIQGAPLPPHVIDEAVLAALEEDAAHNDVTTAAVLAPGQWGRGAFIAKTAGVIAGLPVAAAAMTALDEDVSFDTLVAEGHQVIAGTTIAEVEGQLAAILACERVALNFLQRLSGIATLTRDFVDAVQDTNAVILDTRKTTPGLRVLERYAVRAGGGRNHRFALADGILIKDNHIEASKQDGTPHLGDIVRQVRKSAPHTLRIEIECTDDEQVAQALEGGADVILLDNMDVEAIRAALRVIDGRAQVEASGGITLANVAEIARTGVDFISIGRLTHSAPALDISLDISTV